MSEHLNVFNLMGILSSIPPMVPDAMWIRPDIAPDRIIINYEFSVYKFPHKRWSYQFVIRDDWTESYLMRNVEVIKKQIKDGLAVFVSELTNESDIT